MSQWSQRTAAVLAAAPAPPRSTRARRHSRGRRRSRAVGSRGVRWPKSEAPASAEDRLRQFDAGPRLFREVSRETPLVLILDDAHWADRPSVLLLQRLARTLRDERLLLMVNHRDTEHESATVAP
ncbi:MAG: AAA family ATPase [Geodermatophilaceae bacterium]